MLVNDGDALPLRVRGAGDGGGHAVLEDAAAVLAKRSMFIYRRSQAAQ